MFNIETTSELKALQELQAIDEISSSIFNSFVAESETAYKKFWFEGESPEVKMQVLGKSALSMFTRSAQAQGFIKMIMTAQGKEYTELGIPEGFEIKWNQDGSGELIDNRVI